MEANLTAEELRWRCDNLTKALQEERERREAAEEDRARLKRARDELAKTVLLLESRATEAEEEAAIVREQLATATRPAAVAAAEQQQDLEVLLKELDNERDASTALVKQLDASRAETAKTAEKLVAAEKKMRALQQQQRSKSKARGTKGDGEEAEQLQQRVAQLKTARDRLIEALDSQAADAERLSIENVALAEAAVQASELAQSWEAQTQEALRQIDRLKDILEESASWGMNGLDEEGDEDMAEGEHSSSGGGEEIGGNSKAERRREQRLRRAEAEVLAEQARCARLEVQVRALCAELTRVVASSAALHRATHPVLCGVEGRLTGLLKTNGRA